MGLGFLIVGVVISVLILIGATQLKGVLRSATLLLAGAVFVLALIFSSIAYVGPNDVGIVTKNALGRSLTDGRIIATSGEMGVQAAVLPPGWHAGYWPIVYTVHTVPLTDISGDEVGIIEARDGQPLPAGQLFAPVWGKDSFQQMLDAPHFLTAGKGYKGKQASVLTPGRYRINTELFTVTKVKQTEVKAGEVAVLTANYGVPPTKAVTIPVAGGTSATILLAGEDEMGIRATALPPGKYPINTSAFTVTDIWTTEMVAHYTVGQSGNPITSKDGINGHLPSLEEREIMVRTSDGFTFPVDVRVSYKIEPSNAPILVARMGDDEGDRFRNAFNSAVRASFRNAAEGVRALDYVQMRSQQESLALTSIAKHMKDLGVTVTAVNIGNIGDEKTLGTLLKTQTDREIAKQEQVTFAEQQKAAEKKKELSRVQQESDEEKKLATAAYAVKIADEEKKRRIIEAKTESEAITIKASAQADAYQLIANQIGKSNAALVEILKIVGERNIMITPRVMVAPGTGSGGMGSALMGTMIDSMIDKSEPPTATPAPAKPKP